MASPSHAPTTAVTLDADTTQPPPQSSQLRQNYTYYHAGPLFTLAELTSNARLASTISQLSGQKFTALLPQNIEQRGPTTPHSIRDADIRALLSCDLALFTYDGVELDSGTVVEYMFAKFADIPAVILRTDFRGAGDQGPGEGDGNAGDKWNLMSSFFPRTAGVVVESMQVYQQGCKIAGGAGGDGQEGAKYLIEQTAAKVVEAFEKVLKMPAVLPKVLRPRVYEWLALMPAFKEGSDEQGMKDMLNVLMQKEDKGLF